MNKRLIITGGLGYIGSHVLANLEPEFEVLIIDDLSNSDKKILTNISELTNKKYRFEKADLKDLRNTIKIFGEFNPDIVMHLAGKKSVPESIINPIKYYENNVIGTLGVLKAMGHVDCKKIIFSSSATVYGVPSYLPIDEKHPTNPVNPYGMSKLISERIIEDWCLASTDRAGISLRYFNPVGAHKSGMLFEVGFHKSSNLMPKLLEVADGQCNELTIFGKDYETNDGSGVRDYIHVVDLAEAHLSSVRFLEGFSGYEFFNIGTGLPSSVFQMISCFENSNCLKVRTKLGLPRVGDVAEVWAHPGKANTKLKWEAKRGIREMCIDSWLAYRKTKL